ncbi:MAG: redoxin domain-containing protein [Phycisphaerae bacterium]|nr:redoxin domain-containing protein [Phycisphaerae bacterium]
MTSNNKNKLLIAVLIILFAIFAFAILRKPKPKMRSLDNLTSQQPADNSHSLHDNSDKPMTLKEIVSKARNWSPSFQPWFSKPAPDFTITDINGNLHKLSDYKGKNVILVFWATWCGPCRVEIPHLIALRNILTEDQLQIIAISNENPALIKQFVNQNKLNYTVAAVDTRQLPEPFNKVTSIPASFYIDEQGSIKFATIGTTTLGYIKAILNAEQ